MLKTHEPDTQDKQVIALSEPKLQEKSIYMGAQEYLDFNYGNEPVEIMFPDGTTAKIVVANTGKIYFQLANKDR